MSRNNSDLDKMKVLNANTASNSNNLSIKSNPPVVYDWEDSGVSALDVINAVDKKVRNLVRFYLNDIIYQSRKTQINQSCYYNSVLILTELITRNMICK